MSDFFEDLEHQLREAARERRGRLRRARVRRVTGVGAALVVLAGAGVGLATAVGGGRGDGAGPAGRNPRSTMAPETATTRTTPARPLSRSDAFRLAVLNGTTTPGAAAAAARLLQRRGFRIELVTNAPTQNASSTRVFFRPGHLEDGRLVAYLLRGARSVAAPTPAPSDLIGFVGSHADVIVVVGGHGLAQVRRRRSPGAGDRHDPGPGTVGA